MTLFIAIVASVSISKAQSPDSLVFYQDAKNTNVSEYFANILKWKSLPGDEYHSGNAFNLTIDYQNIEKGEMILRGWTDKTGRSLYAETFNSISTKYYYTIVVIAIKNEVGEIDKFEWKLFDVKASFNASYSANYSTLSDDYLYKIRSELKEIALNNAEIEYDNYFMSKFNRMKNELLDYEHAANDETASRRQQKRNKEAYNEFKTKVSVYEKVYEDVHSLLLTLKISTWHINQQ